MRKLYQVAELLVDEPIAPYAYTCSTREQALALIKSSLEIEPHKVLTIITIYKEN